LYQENAKAYHDELMEMFSVEQTYHRERIERYMSFTIEDICARRCGTGFSNISEKQEAQLAMMTATRNWKRKQLILLVLAWTNSDLTGWI
jgi:glycerol-3-phosphate dehydrogenase